MRIRITTVSILLTFLLCTTANAGIISRIHSFADGDTLTASQLNAEFNNVVDGVNSIDNSNISSSAALSPIKISAAIAGSGTTRNTSTGALSPTVDNSTIDIGGSGLEVIAIPNLSVSTGKIVDAAVTTVKILDANVTTVKILDANVTTPKIADASITQAKRAALGQQISSTSGVASTASTSFTTSGGFAALSVTIVTTGRPVFVGLVSDGSGSPCFAGTNNAGGGGASLFRIMDGASEIAQFEDASSNSSGTIYGPCSAIHHIYVPSAASHTITIQAKVTAATALAIINDAKLVAYEL